MALSRTLPIVLAAVLAVPAFGQIRRGVIGGDVRPGNVDAPSVYVRDSGVAVEKLALAQRLERQKEWDKAADVYTEIAQKYADRVVPSVKDADGKPQQYVSAARAVQDKLATWPAEGLAAYRRRFEDTARDLLNAGTPDAATRVVALYYATDAGRDAASAEMSDAFERGDVSTAAAVGRRLLASHPGLQAERPRVIVQTAVAEHLAGRDGDATALLDELKAKHADALVHVAGRDVKAADALAEALTAPAVPAVFRGDDWPTAFGTPDAAGVPERVSAGGARLFGVELSNFFPRGAAVSQSPGAKQAVATLRNSGGLTGVMPSVDGGELFFQDNARVYGVSLASGQALPGWQATYGNTRGAYAVEAVGATPRGKQLGVAVTPTHIVALLAQNDNAHLQFGLPPTTPQLVGLDRATGRRAWETSPDRLKLPNDQGGLKAGVFYGNPLVDGDTVYALLNANRGGQFDECYVVALGLADGAYKWSAYVSSVSIGNRMFGGDAEPQTTTGTAAAVSISGGKLYVLTNLGALACLDGGNGTVLWLNVYPALDSHGRPRSAGVSAAEHGHRQAVPVRPAGRVGRPCVRDAAGRGGAVRLRRRDRHAYRRGAQAVRRRGRPRIPGPGRHADRRPRRPSDPGQRQDGLQSAVGQVRPGQVDLGQQRRLQENPARRERKERPRRHAFRPAVPDDHRPDRAVGRPAAPHFAQELQDGRRVPGAAGDVGRGRIDRQRDRHARPPDRRRPAAGDGLRRPRRRDGQARRPHQGRPERRRGVRPLRRAPVRRGPAYAGAGKVRRGGWQARRPPPP